MAIKLTNEDYVLAVTNPDYAAQQQVDHYGPFFEALSLDRYSFQREAMQRALTFLLSTSYSDTSVLASQHFAASIKLQGRYSSQSEYLSRFALRDRKSVSLDLATGAGKSFVLYGIARAALAMGFVDKVLVLCPSLTIEDGLKDKFRELSARQDLKQLMEALGAVHPNPPIKSANDPILEGDICIENIHAVYDRTGSSISDSFRGKGARTLVLNDEAHHIYSGADSATKKWLEFLLSKDYGFHYIVGATGTPYIDNDYFPDVIYRYGLKQAIDEHVVKVPDYVTEQLLKDDIGYAQILDNHVRNRNLYPQVKPVSIVVTEKILKCVQVREELVKQVQAKDGLTRAEAEERVIWVASGIPSGTDGQEVRRLVPDADKVRKDNLRQLRSVSLTDNPVEWIVSVSMLTEGWDVPNVFQVVPWETKAFNSKLLIAQVLGRGLRVPAGLKAPVRLTVANHERWTTELKKLFDEVLEIENRLGSAPTRPQFAFPLHNLDYVTEQVTEQTSGKRAREPEAVQYAPQAREVTQTTTYSQSGNRSVLLLVPDLMTIEDATVRIRAYLVEKDAGIAADWSKKRVRELIDSNLRRWGCPTDFLSRENLLRTQHAFGPMFRSVGSTVPRQKLRPQGLHELDPMLLPIQSVSEDQLRGHTAVYYTNDISEGFQTPSDRALWLDWEKKATAASELDIEELSHFKTALKLVKPEELKCLSNLLIARYQPERKFIESLLTHAALFDAFFKNSDNGFYAFPYSYKPSGRAATHAKTEFFNPDFFLKLAERHDVLVVEIKADGDDSHRNRAKARDAKAHFERLNEVLLEQGEQWRYHFYFLSEEDYGTFFSAVAANNLAYQSTLMMALGETK